MNNIICPECGGRNNISHKNKKKLCKDCQAKLLLNDKYYLVRLMGQNIGTTYKAIDNNKKDVIIKELTLRTLDRWKTEELFRREASVLSKLDHPNIPNFIDNFSAGKRRNTKMYLVMEFIKGRNINGVLKGKEFKIDEVLDIMRKVAEILKYLHNFHPPIIHRDLKPSNLIKKYNGEVAIIDFGSVIDIIQPNGGATIAGTMGYMAPEQILGIATKESDYYSLGVTAIAMLTGKNPESMLEGRKLNWKKYTHFDKDLNNFFEKLLNEDSNKRFSSADEIIITIDDFLNTERKIDKNTNNISDIPKEENITKEELTKYQFMKKIIRVPLGLSSFFIVPILVGTMITGSWQNIKVGLLISATILFISLFIPFLLILTCDCNK